MGNLSSINFAKSKDWQVWHNSSERPDYAIGGEVLCNRNGYEALELKNQMVSKAKESYAKTCNAKNKKFQATSYEWSAVCNIKPNTTMQDLESLANYFQKEYGIQCYQIAIHRDEGHINDNGERVINHHAHLEFITLDKDTGKNNWRRQLITPKALRKMQTDTASILKMERGQDKRLSGAKRIEPRAYAKIKESERAERLKTKQNQNQHEDLIKNISHILNNLDKSLKIDTRDKNHIDAFELHMQRIQELEQENEVLKELATQKEVKAEFESLRKELIATQKAKQEDYKILSQAKNEALELVKSKDLTIQDLQEKIAELQNQLKNTPKIDLKQENDEILMLRQENQNLAQKHNKLVDDFNNLRDKSKEIIESLQNELSKARDQKAQINTQNTHLRDKRQGIGR